MTFGRIAKILILLWIGLHVLLVFTVGATALPYEDFVFMLLFGWIRFVFHRLQRIEPSAPMIGSGIVYAAALVFVSQLFLRGLARGAQRGWRWKWTLQIALVFVLMFVVGLAASGILRSIQAMSAPHVRVYKGYHEDRYKAACEQNLIKMGQALAAYAKAHGSYPRTVNEVSAELGDVDFDHYFDPTFVVKQNHFDASGRSVDYFPYIYLGADVRPDADASTPIVIEPMSNHDDAGIHVLRKDGTVDWLDHVDGPALLAHTHVTKAQMTEPTRYRMSPPTSQPATAPMP